MWSCIQSRSHSKLVRHDKTKIVQGSSGVFFFFKKGVVSNQHLDRYAREKEKNGGRKREGEEPSDF